MFLLENNTQKKANTVNCLSTLERKGGATMAVIIGVIIGARGGGVGKRNKREGSLGGLVTNGRGV